MDRAARTSPLALGCLSEALNEWLADSSLGGIGGGEKIPGGGQSKCRGLRQELACVLRQQLSDQTGVASEGERGVRDASR